MNSRIVAELLESFPKLLLPGLKVTLPLTALSFTIGIAIALATALVQIAHIPVLRRLARVYIWIIRCTPMIVQLFVVYFGLPNIGICLDSFSAAVLVFSISVGAYCSETIRAAIESVSVGQMEAGYCAGLNIRSDHVPRNHTSGAVNGFSAAVQCAYRTCKGHLARVQRGAGRNTRQRPAHRGAHLRLPVAVS